MDAVVNFARLFAVLGGAIACYGAFFLYEDEEQAVQNVLEQWWIRVDDLRRSALSRHTAITRAAAELAQRILNRLFGARLLSLRMIGVSGCLSIASLHFVSSWLANYAKGVVAGKLAYPAASASPLELFRQMYWALAGMLLVPTTSVEPPMMMHLVGLVALTVVFLSIVIGRLSWLPLGFFAAFFLVFFGTMLFARPYPSWMGIADITLAAVVVGVVCDIVAITLARSLITWQTEWESFFRMLVAALLELVVAVSLIIAPFIIGLILMERMHGASLRGSMLGWGALLSPTTNILTAATSLAFFGAVTLLIMHRLVWPAISRPLYRLTQLGVYRSTAGRVVLFGVGSGAIAVGLGRTGAVLDRLLSLLGSG